MTLPKALYPDSEYQDDIRDEHGVLIISVCGNGPERQEIRDELIRRWNAYTVLRDTLAIVTKLVNENT